MIEEMGGTNQTFKEGKVKKLLPFIAIFCLIMPLTFLGCSGDDGAAGAPGQPGDPGAPGPGAMANETCVICHDEGKVIDAAAAHAEIPNGSVTVTINDVTMTVNGDNVTTVVTFDFAATDAAGNPVEIDLTEASRPDRLAYIRFAIAKLDPGTNGDADSWFNYMESSLGTTSSRNPENLTDNGGGNYTYAFEDNAVLAADFLDNTTHRVAIQVSSLNASDFSANPNASAPFTNATFDFVPDGSAVTLTKEVVTTGACNACHNPLRIHGSRVEIDYCVVCHNPQLEEFNLVNLVHKIHSAQEVGGEDFTEVTYPQDLRNCTTCHQGGADSDNYKTRPTIEACGACHGVEIFEPGGDHPFPQDDNAGCTGCHDAEEDGVAPSIPNGHATENVTPNNPQLPEGLSQIEYFIDSVTVDNTNVATVEFRILQDNVLMDLTTWPPEGFADTNGPGFLLAWTLPQDGIDTPVDYNNLGQTAGQPPSVSLKSLVTDNLVTASGSGYTAVLSSQPFPDNAVMRAVALQAYFTQDTGTDNVARHTPSVVMAVDGDDERRVVVKSGYEDEKPVGCLECHEIFEGHGGNRVNNVQVCVMCHNPNLSSGGRTSTSNVSVPPELGDDPLTWPEATNNMKELIHGIHAATDRPYEFVRNRGGGRYYNWSEVTFPGNLADCQKCHLEGTYNAAPEDALWTTERTTTGNAAETLDDILGARDSVPNDTDLVNSPTSSACFYCHDSSTPASHMVLNGGKLGITRGEAKELP